MNRFNQYEGRSQRDWQRDKHKDFDETVAFLARLRNEDDNHNVDWDELAEAPLDFNQ